jgi:hypothetical protein
MANIAFFPERTPDVKPYLTGDLLVKLSVNAAKAATPRPGLRVTVRITPSHKWPLTAILPAIAA